MSKDKKENPHTPYTPPPPPPLLPDKLAEAITYFADVILFATMKDYVVSHTVEPTQIQEAIQHMVGVKKAIKGKQ